MNKNVAIISIAVVFGCVSLGGFYYAVEVKKQISIEKQQEIKTTNDRKIEEERKQGLESCLNEATNKMTAMRKDYCKLDKKEILADGTCFLSKERVDYLNERLDEERGVCFKKFP